MASSSDEVTILVVDDSREVREATLRLLRVAGYNAVGAVDGGDGLRKANELDPVAIITDLRMPILNGVELAENLARAPRLKHIPVIATTASADLIPGRPGLFRAVLSKPYRSDELLNIIANLVR